MCNITISTISGRKYKKKNYQQKLTWYKICMMLKHKFLLIELFLYVESEIFC
jgi:hypothetical protein